MTKSVPDAPDAGTPTSVYRLYNKDGLLLYVGITGRKLERMYQHAMSKPWWGDVVEIHVNHLPTRDLALKREEMLIKGFHPVHNKQHARVGKPYRLPPRVTVETVEKILQMASLIVDESQARGFTEHVSGMLGVGHDLVKRILGSRMDAIVQREQMIRKLQRNQKDDRNAEKVRAAQRKKIAQLSDSIGRTTRISEVL